MLARSRRKILILDGGAPRNAVAAHMHGVLGRDGWSPLQLVAIGRDEIRRYGGEVTEDRAISIERRPDHVVITLESGQVHATRRLLVATGLRDELPAIPGLVEHWGSGVAHCPYCDGWEARDSRIAVVATGAMSLHQAQLLRQLSSNVTYFVEGTDLPEADLAALVVRGIAIETRRIAAIESIDSQVSSIRLHDGARIPADSVFIRPRSVPNDMLLHQTGAAGSPGVDDHDWITVDSTGRTSVPEVWAAGNVVNPAATVPVSAAAGSTAGAAINADLVDDEIRSAFRAHQK